MGERLDDDVDLFQVDAERDAEVRAHLERAWASTGPSLLPDDILTDATAYVRAVVEAEAERLEAAMPPGRGHVQRALRLAILLEATEARAVADVVAREQRRAQAAARQPVNVRRLERCLKALPEPSALVAHLRQLESAGADAKTIAHYQRLHELVSVVPTRLDPLALQERLEEIEPWYEAAREVG